MDNGMPRIAALLWFVGCASLFMSGCTSDDDDYAEPPYGVWEDFIGQDPLTPALPDYFANYFAYAFDREADSSTAYVGLRIVGEFGYARYMSYNIYDAVEGTSFGAVTDFQMKPLPGNLNPFVPGTSFQATNREYAVTVAPEDYAANPDDNVFIFADEAIRYLTVVLRYYVPQGDAIANVPIPTIEAFDIRSGDAVDLPARYSVKTTPIEVFQERMRPLFNTIVDDTLRFYRSPGGGQFNCADNLYLINAIEMTPDDVVTLRLFPPTFPSSNSEFGQTDVRYWSLNQGNDDTTTPLGVHDSAFTVSSDGFVYVAIGDDSIGVRAQQLGYNFMPWRAQTAQGTLLYKNILTNPGYPGAISQVPYLDLSNPANVYLLDAKNYIGDYAPTGQKVSGTDFMNGLVGIVPPGN
ncbi:MAG: hypothetical protein JXA58_03630 [Dehalococcoidia bacterium]|nr:hypothetical protein [Dehalococcoidia bacterium]